MPTGPSTMLSVPFDEAVAATRAALADEGFGVLTEIDMQATMKNKLGEEYPPLVILGACNPGFAHRAMGVTSEVATLLPCNVVLRQTAEGVSVETIDPQMLVQVTNEDRLAPLAQDLREKLDRVFAALTR
ncbi:MAG: DUF302 domain-containing protein [Candidatus Nanopelagicales bacterium]